MKITKYVKGKRGFTLIEILIVVSIIGLLASVVLVGLSSFRSRGRDTRRVADLKAIQNGLELFYAKNNQYPTAPNYSNLVTILKGAGIGISKMPQDPGTGGDYYYSYLSGASAQGYVIAARLEADASDLIYNDSNKDALTTGSFSGSVPSCSAPYYCVSF